MCPPHLRTVRHIACTALKSDITGEPPYHPLALDVGTLDPRIIPFVTIAAGVAMEMSEPKLGFGLIFEELKIDGVNPLGRKHQAIQEKYRESFISGMTEEEILAIWDEHIPTLQGAAKRTLDELQIQTLGELGVENETFTPDGVVKTTNGQPGLLDPRTLGENLNAACLQLIALPNGRLAKEVDYLADEFAIADTSADPRFERLRQAAQHFYEQPGVANGLREVLLGHFAAMFLIADYEIEHGIGTDVPMDICPKCLAKNFENTVGTPVTAAVALEPAESPEMKV
jgi:hypothetical protein